jgi:hypothetical protein
MLKGHIKLPLHPCFVCFYADERLGDALGAIVQVEDVIMEKMWVRSAESEE